MAEQLELQARDEVLDRLVETRARLVKAARATAQRIARTQGRVTSIEVLQALRQEGYGPELDRVDTRFLGGVFRKGWKRIGWEPTGSHARPVAIWALP